MKNLFLLLVVLAGLVTAGCDWSSFACKKDDATCAHKVSCCGGEHEVCSSAEKDENQVPTKKNEEKKVDESK
jgi:hypothetical protein